MKKLIIIISIIFCSNLCKSQVHLSQLSGTTWRIIEPVAEDELTTWKITSTQITEKSCYSSDNSTYEFTDYYYLSDIRPTPFYSNDVTQVKFDQTKVGKSLSGNYLVIYIDKRKRIDWYTITSFDLKTGDMYLLREAVEDECPSQDVTLHLKLISAPASNSTTNRGNSFSNTRGQRNSAGIIGNSSQQNNSTTTGGSRGRR